MTKQEIRVLMEKQLTRVSETCEKATETKEILDLSQTMVALMFAIVDLEKQPL